jgi:hypothetical protein
LAESCNHQEGDWEDLFDKSKHFSSKELNVDIHELGAQPTAALWLKSRLPSELLQLLSC